MIYLASDWHINHTNIIKYGNRPFINLNEMQESLAQSFSILKPEDTLYYLGDFWVNSEELLRFWIHQLPCPINVIIGNHDNINIVKKICPITDYYYEGLYRKGNQKFPFTLCHYPLLSWNHDSRGSYMFHGHCHGNINNKNIGSRRLDVGYDSTRQWIISMDDAIKLADDNYKKDINNVDRGLFI